MFGNELIVLDTNVLIFGIEETDRYCKSIIDNLFKFNIFIPRLVMEEMRRNLALHPKNFKFFLKIITNKPNIIINEENITEDLTKKYRSKGLKKGDIFIGAAMEAKKARVIISMNRHFLQKKIINFIVMNPQEFYKEFLI